MEDQNLSINDGNEQDELDDLELKIGAREESTEEEKTEKDEIKEENVIIAKSKIVLVKKLLENIKENNEKIMQLLNGSIDPEEEARISIGQVNDDGITIHKEEEEDGRIIEGVFDGENMIGPDGKQYSMPANYASKSKLVEGDIMKLTITDNGTFVYKQIGPIERKRVVGILEQAESGSFTAVADGRKWRILTASVTYYKGRPGDEVVILVPKASESKWAAVDNIVKTPA